MHSIGASYRSSALRCHLRTSDLHNVVRHSHGIAIHNILGPDGKVEPPHAPLVNSDPRGFERPPGPSLLDQFRKPRSDETAEKRASGYHARYKEKTGRGAQSRNSIVGQSRSSRLASWSYASTFDSLFERGEYGEAWSLVLAMLDGWHQRGSIRKDSKGGRAALKYYLDQVRKEQLREILTDDSSPDASRPGLAKLYEDLAERISEANATVVLHVLSITAALLQASRRDLTSSRSDGLSAQVSEVMDTLLTMINRSRLARGMQPLGELRMIPAHAQIRDSSVSSTEGLFEALQNSELQMADNLANRALVSIFLMAHDVGRSVSQQAAQIAAEQYRVFHQDMDSIIASSMLLQGDQKTICRQLRAAAWSDVEIADYVDSLRARALEAEQFTLPSAHASRQAKQASLEESLSADVPSQGVERPFISHTSVTGDSDPVVSAANEGTSRPKDRVWGSIEEARFNDPDVPFPGFAKRMNKAIGKYVERENLHLVEQAWSQARRKIEAMPLQEDLLPDVHSVFESFLTAFTRLRRPHYTSHVWNTMTKKGYTPNVRTWNALLKGFQEAHAVEKQGQVWQAMMENGIQPNEHSWSIRLLTLFKFKRFTEGLALISELSSPPRTSKKSQLARGNTRPVSLEADDPTFRPTVEVLNSAMSGAARHSLDMVGRLLAWARSMSIEPNVITYNILISAACLNGQTEQATSLLSSMNEAGLEPDASTLAILIKSLLNRGALAGLDSAAQTQRTSEILAEVDASGLRLDDRGYAIIIDRLLKLNDNMRAVEAVLAHMKRHNVQLTTELYTILITHWFAQSPPAIGAIERLWDSMRTKRNFAADYVFFDRMLEGYAKIDATNRTLYFLDRMIHEGKTPGWVALAEVLKSFGRTGRREQARKIVRALQNDVMLDSDNDRTGLRSRKGQAEFWELSEAMGLGSKPSRRESFVAPPSSR